MVSQLTKKQPLIIITLTFSRDFSLVKFREAETYKSGCVLLWFVFKLEPVSVSSDTFGRIFELSLVANSAIPETALT